MRKLLALLPLGLLLVGHTASAQSATTDEAAVRAALEHYLAGHATGDGKPAADEAKRKRRISMVDVTGDAAMAKVELDYPDVYFTDYFTLLKVNGEWKIMNKIFNRGAPRQ